MRGLACVLMFQTHCYDAWLGGDARKSAFFMWSQVIGTLPAPLFLFLAGLSFALVVDKLGRKGLRAGQIARATIRRGAEVLVLGLLFRLQEFLVAWGWAPWTDLFRVDILNTIGVSLMLLGAMGGVVLYLVRSVRIRFPHASLEAGEGWGTRSRVALGVAAVVLALTISLLTPLLWTSWQPHWLPWEIESYINGVHNAGQPQATLFPIFPWSGFAFAGLAFGFCLVSDWARERQNEVFALAGAAGVGLFYFARWLDAQPRQIYATYDYWHTSPSFFLLRVGLLLGISSIAYAWCLWGAGTWGFSPLVQLGQTSLLVYWVHLEFVYGRISILPKRA